MDANGMAYVAIGVAGLFLLIYCTFHALNSGWWKCPACDFRTRSDEEALGHTALHAMHKPIKEL
jgi:hypothetical protein